MKNIVILLFLMSCSETSNSKWPNQEEKTVATNERVLIRSKRRWVVTTIELAEEYNGPFPVKITKLFNDKQNIHNLKFSISGHGVDQDPVGVLSIDEDTGEVYMHKPIDREQYPIFHVEFNVLDKTSGQLLDNTLSFDVAIKDKNDNSPLFQFQFLSANVPENLPEGELPISLHVSDRDEEGIDNSRISMRIVSQEPDSPRFSLKPVNDRLTNLAFTGCFDYDKAKTYTLLLEAKDHGTPSLSSTATVNIDVTDNNTHAPVITAPKHRIRVHEMQANKEILRIPVKDQDTPNTPASRAVFTVLKGNEEGNYKIETDPLSNEGVLTVIKPKDFEKATVTELEIGVENEDPLFICVDGKPVYPIPETFTNNSKIKVTVEVIDVNDPPLYQNKIDKVYVVEEKEPGHLLFTPIVTDVDSDLANIRYELVDDPAKWMSIDPNTGKLTLTKKIDRESPYVNRNTYTVVMLAIDDGNPPATGTGTLVVHLIDTNDNVPQLTSNITTLCVNKGESVNIIPTDADDFPFSGPFTFKLGTEDEELKRLWKLHPSSGDKSSLISLTILPYGTYFVPLLIADQQGLPTHENLKVVVCECTEKDVCEDLGRSSNLHRAAIGIQLGAILLMAFLLCMGFFCECKNKEFKQNLQFDGNQTLIAYNDEGAEPRCKSPIGSFKITKEQFHQYNSNYSKNLKMETGMQMENGVGTTDFKSIYGLSTSRNRNGRMSTNETVLSELNRSFSFNIEDLIELRLLKLKEDQDFPDNPPQEYKCEETNDTGSLDKLSLHSVNELDLQNLGPKFNTLNKICQESIKEKNNEMPILKKV